MKENIVVCCEEMFDALNEGGLFIDGECDIRTDDGFIAPRFEMCPWCGKELPFPYEEEKEPA